MAASSLPLCLFNVCLLLSFADLVISKYAHSHHMKHESSSLELSVHPTAGVSTENIQVRCDISQPSSMLPLSSMKFDNIYISVITGYVIPSGILLKFDDNLDKCELNRENVHVDVCNASLISININHKILNETVETIEYSCKKGLSYATGSYRILKGRSARYHELVDSSSSHLTHTPFLLLIGLFIIRITRRKIQ